MKQGIDNEKMLVRDLIEQHKSAFTPAERRLVPYLKDDSLAIELKSITELAIAADVSTPTVIRFARKLGFHGFPDMQGAVRAELAERIKQPLAKIDGHVSSAHNDHVANRFSFQVVENINRTMSQLDYRMFDDVANMLGDPKNKVYLRGGKISQSSAYHFFNHLQIIRPNVSMLGASPSVWPQTLLDLDSSSVLILFDIRRYEKELEKLALLAASQGAKIVLFTDQWGSPIERIADNCFRAMVEAPSSWDSTIAINLLVECMIAHIQNSNPERSADRIKEMEKMIGVAEIFRKS
ncbi:MurR/RpiR family transcriptional regulator [Cohaesibacter celericrescens]|uniref:RpiR family transcriptional regulator n=1 Tax=Cohaesibacter celericrescens TaxID=2067669 RepID=A0A2N5XMI5_9HYPH|nr:MurR/RpiR family transcriptional regulator [Cohaesibacter celericrescens]PLW75703.1 RpiR family transcriptional regulator [Cohaesibacter celericrescens]